MRRIGGCPGGTEAIGRESDLHKGPPLIVLRMNDELELATRCRCTEVGRDR